METESREGSVYEVAKKPFKVPNLQVNQISSKNTFNSDLPKVGISLVAISHDARFVAAKNELYPTIVWIWDLVRLSLNSVLSQKHEVTNLTWCPLSPTLNVSTGVGRLYLWTERVASVCQVPVSRENFGVQKVIWNPNSRSFAAIDKGTMVFVYPQAGFFGQGISPSESHEEQM